MASTQFQATDARRAFPCLDEPELKAKFSLSLGRTKDMKSVSNMPIKKKGQTMWVTYSNKLGLFSLIEIKYFKC